MARAMRDEETYSAAMAALEQLRQAGRGQSRQAAFLLMTAAEHATPEQARAILARKQPQPSATTDANGQRDYRALWR